MNHYFVTGATGNIGSALIPLLINGGDKITLLIRAESETHLKNRLEDLYDFWELDKSKPLPDIVACRGDMTKPQFGLDEAAYSELIQSCTHIIHCGGVVRMNLPIEEARKSAIGVAKEIVRLGAKLKEKGILKKIDFVSTVGVIGKSGSVLTETLVTEKRSFHNTYEQAKAEAEEFLYPYMTDKSLPITIHRPSMVVGDSRSGKAKSFQVFYHLCEFLSGKRTFGFLPNLEAARLDIIPVDYVAKVIRWAASNSESAGNFLHECAGEKDALKIQDLEKIISGHAHFTIGRKGLCKNNIHLPLPVFTQAIRLIAKMLPDNQKKTLLTLPHFLNYLDDPQRFDDGDTTTKDIKKPQVSEYLNLILSQYTASFSR